MTTAPPALPGRAQNRRLQASHEFTRLHLVMADMRVDRGDIRSDSGIAREILEFIEEHQVRSVAITDGIIGCPHQQGIDYEGEWCPVCEFWHGRDRVAGQRVH